MKPLHLYTPKDVKEVRDLLFEEQQNADAVSKLKIENADCVLDHDHETQLVRAVLHRQSNSFVGKLENNFKRMIAWWYDGSLPDFLRDCANYLETDFEKRYYHPSWMKKCQVSFNRLPEAKKQSVLRLLGQVEGRNKVERVKLFRKALMSREFTFEAITELLKKAEQEVI